MFDFKNGFLLPILASLFLTFLYFTVDLVFNPVPELSGKWEFTTTVKKSSFKPYDGMELTYHILLKQEGSHISGIGEKVYEKSSARETEIVGKYRVPIVMTGEIKNSLFGATEVILQYLERGRVRDSSSQHHLTLFKNKMLGVYVSTIADQSGDVVWLRR